MEVCGLICLAKTAHVVILIFQHWGDFYYFSGAKGTVAPVSKLVKSLHKNISTGTAC